MVLAVQRGHLSSLLQSSDRVYLHLDPTPQRCLNGGAGGADASEETRINLIEPVEIPHIREIAGALHDIVKSAATGVQDLADMRQSELGLIFNISKDNFTILHVQRSLPTYVQPAIDTDSARIRAGGYSFLRVLDFEFRHTVIVLTGGCGEKISCSSQRGVCHGPKPTLSRSRRMGGIRDVVEQNVIDPGIITNHQRYASCFRVLPVRFQQPGLTGKRKRGEGDFGVFGI